MTAPMAPAVQTSLSEWLFVDFFVSFFGFVTIHFLGYKELDAVAVVVAEQFLKLVGLVVFAS